MRPVRKGAALLLAGVVASAGLSGCGSDDSTAVTARFVSAAPLVSGNQVKIDGIVVGTIEDLSVRDGQAEVTMRLDRTAMPIHQDATFTIRPASLLGERYVDLERGSADQPMLDLSRTVPVEQTGTSVGLDEVVNTLDDPTGEGLAQLLGTLGNGVAGQGDDVDAAIVSLAPSMDRIEDLAAVLENHNELLSALVEDAEPVAAAVADQDGTSLDRIVDAADRMLGATADQQEDLDRLIAQLPTTLASARSTLEQLSITAEQTAPTLSSLRPLTDKLPQISREIEAFSDALDPALASSEPVLKRAEELLKVGARPASDLKQAAPNLATTVEGAEPIVDSLTDHRNDVFDFIRFWALNTNGHDGLSHYWRVNLTLSSDTWTGLVGLLTNGGAQQEPTDAATPQQETPSPTGGLLAPQGGLSDLLGGSLLNPSTSGSLTGLSQKQEAGLLTMLLGGGK